MLIEIYSDGKDIRLMRDSYLNSEVVSFSVDLSCSRIKFGNKIKKFHRIRFINIDHLNHFYDNVRHTYYINERDFKKLRRR